MASNIAYVGNTNNLEITGLKSDIEDAFLNDAQVMVTIKDSLGVELDGESWPQTMAYVPGTNGNYVLGLTHFAALVKGGKYTAFISADASDTANERYAYWEFAFTAQTRVK